MPRPYKLYLEDILDSTRKISDYIKGMDATAFSNNSMAYDAVLRNLEIVGEATKKIPRRICAQYPQTEWKKIAGLRDIIIHEYFGINKKILWEIITQKIPVLEKQILILLQNLKKDDLPLGQ